MNEEELDKLAANTQPEKQKVAIFIESLSDISYPLNNVPKDAQKVIEISKIIYDDAHTESLRDLDEVAMKEWFIHMSEFDPY